MSLSDTDPIVKRVITVNEAERYIRAVKRKTLFLHCSQFASIPSDIARGFNVSACVQVSKPTALRYIREAYHATLRAKAGISLAECSSCLFIGSTC